MKKTVLSLIVIVSLSGVLALAVTHKPSEHLKPSVNSTASTNMSRPTTTSGSGTSSGSASSTTSAYKDGTYTGSTIDVGYGPVQVAAVISGGKITNVKILQTPSDLQYSQQVAAYATPILKQEAVSAQSANVQLVSGATATSEGFVQSLQSALNQAI